MKYGKAIMVFLVLAITVTFSQDNRNYTDTRYQDDYKKFDNIYKAAEKISSQPGYSEEKEMAMNQQALDGFLKIIPVIEKAKDDSLAFYCWLKIGILQHYFDSLTAAQRSYQNAIALKMQLPELADSFLFKPYLFIGSIFYSMSLFDSALHNYKKAEQVAAEYKVALSGSNRLYNTLGVLYYEMGNYRQAKNYFEKSMAILPLSDPYYQGLMVNYRLNLASVLTKLEEFDEANSIYLQLLPLDINKNEILHNTAAIHLNLGAFRRAISYLKQVHYNDAKLVSLYNDLGFAYMNLGIKDSAGIYLALATNEDQKWNKGRKNVPHGLTLKYVGDDLESDDDLHEAISKYQQAIVQFYGDFNDKDIYTNPEEYSGVFSYINLFNTLTAKAEAFEKLYQKRKNIRDLEASLDTYRSAFRLADYVEKTYDSDEARLFLNKIKYTVHSKPIDVSLRLFDLTQKKGFLEDAYFFDQRNKASILSLNIYENQLRITSGSENELFARESTERSAITRLSLKASQTNDSSDLAAISGSIRDHEIQLGKIRDKINAEFSYKKKNFDRIPSVNDLQKKLDNNTALLSYHLSENRLLILLISADRFERYLVPISKDFFIRIDSFRSALHAVKSEERYNGTVYSMALYEKLIDPVFSKLSGIGRIIIIPDDELNYLPFEALQDGDRRYLLEKFAIQYQYSTALFAGSEHANKKNNLLAFAPFASNSITDLNGNTLVKLPASKEEVRDLAGNIFTDSLATRQNFIRSANHYGIIHLATHANADNETPLRSFIAFYPGKDTNDYKLYTGEIYGMQLDSTQLIILSACETGAGKLVKGEGLMSISRAFAYAGCPDIITSLWKAQDKTTAFISQRLHYYLKKGFTKDRALQQAKLDLLHNDDIDPRFKSPENWAHLIFIGQYEADHPSNTWWWIAGVIIIVTVAYLLVKRRMR